MAPSPPMDKEALRQWLYASSGPDLPASFSAWVAGSADVAEAAATAPLQLLNHAWGPTPQRVLEAGLRAVVKAAVVGNATWEDVFGKLLPQASEDVLQLLNLAGHSPEEIAAGGAPLAAVHFGANSHELLWRAISSLQEGRAASDPLVILTTDTEFYSLTRQLNRLTTQELPPHPHQDASATLFPAVHMRVEAVAALPAESLPQRLVEAIQRLAPDVVYVSHVAYLNQITLLPDPATALSQLAQALADSHAPKQRQGAATGATPVGGQEQAGGAVHHAPMLYLDGYHAFMALPTDLRGAYLCKAVSSGAVTLGYVAGVLKHAACGPNASFLVMSSAWKPRPLMTGWIADPSVFSARSPGLQLITSADAQALPAGTRRGAVGFPVGLELQGGTPSYVLPLRCFVHLVECLRFGPQGPPGARQGQGSEVQQGQGGEWCLSVEDVHRHVLRLQRRFLQGLRRLEVDAPGRLPLRCGQLVNVPAGVVEGMGAGGDDEGVEGELGLEARARSHTLVFRVGTPDQAAEVVERLAQAGVAVDARKGHVRVGFGLNHGVRDVDILLDALRSC